MPNFDHVHLYIDNRSLVVAV